MSNKESRRYKHDIKRVGDLAERPVEMFKREYDDKTSLVLKSRNIPENEIFVNKNGISSVNPIYINTNVIPFQMSIDLDLSKSKYHYIKLEDDLFVNDIINFENGIEYKFYVSQDEVGSHNITFGNDINGLFKEFGLNLEPNTTTLIKITPINNVLYILFDTNSRENPFYITSLTPLNNSENININQNTLTATFTKEIVFGVGDISIKRFSDDSIFQTFIVDNEVTDADLVISGNTLTINALDFEYDEQYYVTISNGSIVSFDGITFAGISDKNTWTFKTAIPFIFTIDTTLGTGSSFNLPLRQYRKDFETDQYTIPNNYDMLVDWGDGQTSEITSWDDIEKNHTYVSGGTYEIKVTGLCESWGFYDEQIDGYVSTDHNKLTNVNEWGYIGIIDASAMFDSCENINELNGGDIWCKNVNNMDYMFYYSTISTLNVPNWDVGNIINFNFIFQETSLTTLDLSNWNVSNVTNMRELFTNQNSFTTLDLSNWDVSNVTDMSNMFYRCTSLTTLDVSNWDVSNVTDMSNMFGNCSSLTTLDLSNWNVSNVTDMNTMFAVCSSLTTLDLSNWNVSNVTDMSNMFYRCTSLTTLDVSKWNVSNVINMSNMFNSTPLDTPSYDALLIGWSGLPSLQSNVFFHANLAKYQSLEASKARQHIIDTYGWSINDAGQTDAFEFTIDTTLGTGNSFNLPLREGYNYDMLVDWGDGQTSEITSWDDAEKNHTYVSGGTYNVSVRGVCEAWYFNNGGDKLKLTSIDKWGYTGFVNMERAFFGSTNLITANDINEIWCSSVSNMGYMFWNCSSLETLDVSNWDVSKVTNMGSMFGVCSSLETLDVSNWDVSNVSDMGVMFYGCESLTTLDVSNWNVSNVNDMDSMFYNTPLDTTSYDALLIGWSQLPSLQSNVRLDANLAKYSAGAAATARAILTSTPNNWRIYDGGQVV